jgi:hypothetical protein
MSSAGYMHPITLNLYRVNTSGSTPALGSRVKIRACGSLATTNGSPGCANPLPCG